ncbi:MAG TPA: hypothetical protein VHW64_10425 [Nocardioides sp.]|jgi:hypothetical protein|uniref:hypothetical protein n=1 Tax=Nocardioides sp. TaxID=35761 RepID=UPI002E2F9393|nr:hypothetical protein [Nocardioides sp.]HEX3931113.1 hypothetical protein [Nocardioides sp.]
MSVLASLLLTLLLPALAGAVLLSPAAAADPGPEPGTVDGTVDDGGGAGGADLVVARGLAAGLATWLLGSGILTRTVGLTGGAAWTWDVVVAVASLVVLALPRQRRRLAALLAPAARRAGEVSGLAVVVFAPLGGAILTRPWSPLGSTPWYYYGLARQVADLGSIPSTSVEFGISTPFLNDYHLFTTGTAMLLVQDPGHPMASVITVTLLSALLVAVGMVALTSTLGAGRFVSLLAVPFVVAAGILQIRASGYRPETLGLGLGLLMLTLTIDWLHHRRRGSLVGAALMAATLSQVHGIAALVAGTMVAAIALVSIARGPRRRQIVRTAIALAALGAAVAVMGLIFREASGTVHAGGLVDRGGIGDPTWEFFRAARGEQPSMPVSNLSMVRTSVRELYSWQDWWIVPALLLTLLGLWRSRRDAATRQVVGFTLLTLLGLALVASVFMLGWQGYVPRRTGGSRIVLESSLVVPPLFVLGLAAATRASWSWRGRALMATPRTRAVVLLLALTACGVVSMVRVARYDNGQAPSQEDLAVWRSLPLTGHDVVLANGYTEGFIPDVTPAQGLLDGRAPYTFDTQLHDANALLRGGQAFFTDPSAHWGYLAQNHVTWVVVGDPHAYSLATGNVWDAPTALDALRACPGLHQVRRTSALAVYQVVDSGAGGC